MDHGWREGGRERERERDDCLLGDLSHRRVSNEEAATAAHNHHRQPSQEHTVIQTIQGLNALVLSIVVVLCATGQQQQEQCN